MPWNWPRSILDSLGGAMPSTSAAYCCVQWRGLMISLIFMES
jgi:hypothetical protein